jgi:hypothetical protein
LPLLVLAVALALVAPARADAPKAYTSAVLGFTASFPYPVQENADPEGGGTAGAVDPQGVMYMVGVSPPHKDAGDKRTPKEQLDDGVNGMVAKVNGKIASQKDVKLGANPGREVEIDMQGGHATFRAYAVNGGSYIVGVVHKEGVNPPMSPADFFASFKLSPKKK